MNLVCSQEGEGDNLQQIKSVTCILVFGTDLHRHRNLPNRLLPRRKVPRYLAPE